MLALSNFKNARDIERSYERRRNRAAGYNSHVVEFNQLYRELERYHFGKAESEPFRAATPRAPWTQNETELMLRRRTCRENQLAWGEEENGRKVFDRYGTNDFWQIAEINAPIRNSETQTSNLDQSSSPNRYQTSPNISDVDVEVVCPQEDRPVSSHTIQRDSDQSAEYRSTIVQPKRAIVKEHPEEFPYEVRLPGRQEERNCA